MLKKKTSKAAPSRERASHPGGRTDRVSVTLGRVINLGNYNSARVETGFETDTQRNESVREAQVRAFDAAEGFLGDAINKIVEAALAGQLEEEEPKPKKKRRSKR